MYSIDRYKFNVQTAAYNYNVYDHEIGTRESKYVQLVFVTTMVGLFARVFPIFPTPTSLMRAREYFIRYKYKHFSIQGGV